MTIARTLEAGSVAVVGASRVETKRGYQAIRTLLEEKFEGPIYPVNPKETSILGLKCYPRVSAIEDGPATLSYQVVPGVTGWSDVVVTAQGSEILS
jgi:acetyltransferase